MADDSKLAENSFWKLTPQEICAALRCGLQGLSSDEARQRLDQYGPNSDAAARADSILRAVLRRLLEPLSLILLAAGIVSILTGDTIGGSIIVLILTLSIGLDTVQEGHAVRTAEILRRSVALKAEVKRDGVFRQIEVEAVVPGDLLRVRAGDIIPADALILECTAFTTGEAALTGEPYPVPKHPGTGAAVDPDDRSNALFRGSVAQTGEAIAIAVKTGRATVFGAAASALAQAEGPSPFERDLREFGLVIARSLDPRPCGGGAGNPRRVWPAGAGFAIVRRGAGGWSDARTAADDHDRDAFPRRDAHGRPQGDRHAAGCDPRSRRDVGAVHRQDRHAHFGGDHAGAQPQSRWRRRCTRGSARCDRSNARRRSRLARCRAGNRFGAGSGRLDAGR